MISEQIDSSWDHNLLIEVNLLNKNERPDLWLDDKEDVINSSKIKARGARDVSITVSLFYSFN